jgi:hypothetical protein
MTVAELIQELSKHDPSRLVCIDRPGFFPCADSVEVVDAYEAGDGETYDLVVLWAGDWP